ncbi:MAG: sodium:calcium antiporter [Acidimicrobiales bacterium]
MHLAVELVSILAGVGLIVFGAETFAEHLSAASARLGVTTFALAVLLAGAEPEELATTVTASLRHSAAIAYGDVIGANIAMCLVALGVGAVIAPLPFRGSALRYGLLGLPLGAVAAGLAWRGHLARWEGGLLVGLYVAYVGTIWITERRPPSLGEAAELDEAIEALGEGGTPSRLGREMGLVLLGVAATIGGAVLLVDGAKGLTHVESTQTRLGLILVGFATAFELVVLAWSSARRGISEAVVAGVVGSFAYNVTMSLGAGALARPLRITNPTQLHGPWVAMVVCLAVVLALAGLLRRLPRPVGGALLIAYPLVAWLVLG